MTLRVGHVLGATAFLVSPLIVLAPLGLAPLIAAAALAALTARLMHARGRNWHGKPAIALFGLLIVLGLVSALWSIQPAATLHKLPQLAGILACGVVLLDAAVALDQNERRLVGRLLVIGLVVGLAILAVERGTGFPIRRLHGQSLTDLTALQVPYKRALTVIALLVWPAALTLWRIRPGLAGLLLAATLAVMLAYDSHSAPIALLFGLAVAAAAACAPRAAIRTLSGLLIVYIAAAPLLHERLLDAKEIGLRTVNGNLNSEILPRSGYHRLLIWEFAARHIVERPMLGWGLESSRFMPGGKALLDTSEQAMPLHPHNAVLQIWLELGIAGAALLAALIGWTLHSVSVSSWPRAEKATTLAAFAATAMIANLAYGVWQAWWLAAMFLVAVFVIGVAATAPPQLHRSGAD